MSKYMHLTVTVVPNYLRRYGGYLPQIGGYLNLLAFDLVDGIFHFMELWDSWIASLYL